MSIKALLLFISLSVAVSLSLTTASANTLGGGTGKGPDKNKILSPEKHFYYQVTAVNVGGISPPANGHVMPK